MVDPPLSAAPGSPDHAESVPSVHRALVVFDIDGVIGPIAERPAGAPGTHLGFGMWWHAETAAQLQRLHRKAMLAWCTSWDPASVNELGPLLGLPSGLPHEWAVEVHRTVLVERLQARLAPTRTVWVDDRPGPGSRTWAKPSERLLLRPNKRVGLTSTHWMKIDEFLTGSPDAGPYTSPDL